MSKGYKFPFSEVLGLMNIYDIGAVRCVVIDHYSLQYSDDAIDWIQIYMHVMYK